MSTLTLTSSILEDNMCESLFRNLNKSFGKSIALQAGLKTNTLLLQKDYIPSKNETVRLDAIMYSKSKTNTMIIGFIVLDKYSFKKDIPKIIEAKKYCHKLYLVTDLKVRNSLYDLLDYNDLNDLGVVGRMSNHQFVLCKTANSQELNKDIYVEKVLSTEHITIERKQIETTNRYKNLMFSSH